MSARGWAHRLPGGPSDPRSERPDQGPGSPARSNGPDPVPGPTLRPGPPVPEPRGSALRVVLVSRDNMLAGALRSLIEAPGGVRMVDWHSDELDGAIRHADVVVVDMPPSLHERTFGVIDGRFLGRTVVLLQEGEHAEALPPGPPRAVLYRPLQIAELWAAVTGAQPVVPPTPESPAEGPEAADPGPGADDGEAEVPDSGAEKDGPEEGSGPEAGLATPEDEAAGSDDGPDDDGPAADAVVLGPADDVVPAEAEAAPADPGEPESATGAGEPAQLVDRGDPALPAFVPAADTHLIPGTEY